MTNRADIGLLLLHALPLDGRMWHAQQGLHPNASYAPNLYDMGGDLGTWAETCLNRMHQRRLLVVGCSVGGSCAFEIAHRAPERVAGLILIGTKAGHNPDPAAHKHMLDCLKNQGVPAAWDRFWRQLFTNTPNTRAQQRAKQIAFDQSTQNLMNGVNAFHTRVSREGILGKIRCPVHIVTGEQDNLPGVAYSQTLAARAARGKLHVIKECGHYVPMVQPAKLNRIIADVLAQIATI